MIAVPDQNINFICLHTQFTLSCRIKILTAHSCECCDTTLSVHASSAENSHRLSFHYCALRVGVSGSIYEINIYHVQSY